ncbi:TPA: DNA methyltransferase, partial [Klebsiella pneumoniae]
ATETDLEKSFKSVFGNTKFFEDHIFKDILSYQCYISSIEDENLKRLLTIAGIRSLIPSSLLVRRGDLRFKTQKELEKGNQGFRFHVQKSLELIASDLLDITEGSGLATFLCDDAKEISGNNLIDAVITSPPYLNGTNYFRNTKIELWFIGKLKTKSDLRHYRDLAITSGINDVTKGKSLSSNNTIISEIPLLSECIKELSIKEYDSRISMMVENYFWDMFKFLSKLPKLLTNDATICIDLGDSVYCNVYIPTQDILKEMMSKLGFEENERVILRERKSRNGTKLVQTVQVFK